MKGQWIGTYKGTNTGDLIMEFDEFHDHYEGRAFVFDQNRSLPATFAFIRTPNKSDKFEVEIPVSPLDPISLDVTAWRTSLHDFQGSPFRDRQR